MKKNKKLYDDLYKALYEPYMKAMTIMKEKGYDIKAIFKNSEYSKHKRQP